MINSNDFVEIYNYGVFDSIDIAGRVRGFKGDKVGVVVKEGYIEVDRSSGIHGGYIVKVITEGEFMAKYNELRAIEESRMREEEERFNVIFDKANTWYSDLPSEQKEYVEALIKDYVNRIVAW